MAAVAGKIYSGLYSEGYRALKFTDGLLDLASDSLDWIIYVLPNPAISLQISEVSLKIKRLEFLLDLPFTVHTTYRLVHYVKQWVHCPLNQSAAKKGESLKKVFEKGIDLIFTCFAFLRTFEREGSNLFGYKIFFFHTIYEMLSVFDTIYNLFEKNTKLSIYQMRKDSQPYFTKYYETKIFLERLHTCSNITWLAVRALRLYMYLYIRPGVQGARLCTLLLFMSSTLELTLKGIKFYYRTSLWLGSGYAKPPL